MPGMRAAAGLQRRLGVERRQVGAGQEFVTWPRERVCDPGRGSGERDIRRQWQVQRGSGRERAISGGA